LVLRHRSPDGEDGYPGTLEVSVRYELTPRNELLVDYRATTDRATPVNFTLHAYFNLAGHDAGSALDHELTLGASYFLPVTSSLIPTGEVRSVRDTPFDFTTAARVGARLGETDDQ